MSPLENEEQIRAHKLAEVEAQVAVLRTLPDTNAAVGSLLDFGNYLVDSGLSLALEPVLAALEQLKDAGPLPEAVEGWLVMLGGLRDLHLGRLDSANRAFREAHRVGLSAGDLGLTASSLQNLGIVSWWIGKLDEAEASFQASNDCRPENDLEGYATVLVDLAGLYLDMGKAEEFAQTVRRLAESPALTRRGADRAALLGLQGLLAVQESRLEDAERLLQASVLASRRRGRVGHEVVAPLNLGSGRIDLGRPGLALRALRRAVRLAWVLEDYRQLELALRAQATALVRAGRFQDARLVLETAGTTVMDRIDFAAHARIQADLGALLLIWKRPAEAVPVIKAALDFFARGRDTTWGRKAALNLGLALARAGSGRKAERAGCRARGRCRGDATSRHAPHLRGSTGGPSSQWR